MQICSMTVQQLTTTNEIYDADSHLFPGSVGAILYEIAPGASFLSQQQIANVMRAAAKHFKRGRTSDVTIMVERDGTVSYRVENPGLVQV
ncbi:MAG: hypothetical protein HYX67_12725 [Candidatus Melainabacteria bacterium]|nr:hypothetical protein [Candidatus Melainabacteria bacterium]